MAFTFEERLAKLKSDRSQAVNQKVAASAAKATALEEDQFYDTFLFGSGGDIGVINLIYDYYEEIEYLNGETVDEPSSDSSSVWGNEFTAVLNGSTSSTLPMYTDATDQEINYNSDWFNDNEDSPTDVEGLLDKTDTFFADLDTAIGEDASDASDGRTSGYDYVDSAAALAAGRARADTDNGSGLRGARTQNADVTDSVPEITTEQDPGVGTNWRYIVGASGVDHADYFNTTERTALLDALDPVTGLIGKFIVTASGYSAHLTQMLADINAIKNGTNQVFADGGMADDVDDDATAIQAVIDALAKVGTSGDSQSYDGLGPDDDTLYAYYNYFNHFSADTDLSSGTEAADYDQTVFNAYLTDLDDLAAEIEGALNTRYTLLTGISSPIGDTGTAINDFTKLRKWRTFWITSKIGKPNGSKIAYEGLSTAVTSTEAAITASNDGLSALGISTSEYIPKPKVLAAYYNPIINTSTGQTVLERCGVVVQGQDHATAYKIYRRTLSDSYNSNNEWNIPIYRTQTELDEETGFVSLIFDDENVEDDTAYIYRVTVEDDTNDAGGAGTTQSVESDIFYEDTAVSFNGITNSVVTFSEAHGLSKRQYVYIKMTLSDPAIDGFYRIVAADELTISFFEDLNTTGSGKIYPIACVATTELPVVVIPTGGAGDTETADGATIATSAVYIKHEWNGTSLRVYDADGIPGPYVNLRGPIGPQGPEGTVDLTDIEWQAGDNYSVNDIAFYQGEIYAALTNNIAQTPSSSPTHWQVIASNTDLDYVKLNDASSQQVDGDFIILGNLTVAGTQAIINTETTALEDNIILINSNEAGTPTLDGGLEIERGTSTNYQILFEESSDTFKIGEIGSLQAVATREDAPSDTSLAYWNDAANRFDTATSVTTDGTGALSATTLTGTTSVTSPFLDMDSTSTRNKINLYGGSNPYDIGMDNFYTFGGLNNDWAMTFQFNNDPDRGFWWGDDSHTNAQGAMALTTEGKLTIAHSVRVGYGEADTTTPGATDVLDVNGSIGLEGSAQIVFNSTSNTIDFNIL